MSDDTIKVFVDRHACPDSVRGEDGEFRAPSLGQFGSKGAGMVGNNSLHQSKDGCKSTKIEAFWTLQDSFRSFGGGMHCELKDSLCWNSVLPGVTLYLFGKINSEGAMVLWCS